MRQNYMYVYQSQSFLKTKVNIKNNLNVFIFLPCKQYTMYCYLCLAFGGLLVICLRRYVRTTGLASMQVIESMITFSYICFPVDTVRQTEEKNRLKDQYVYFF